MADQDWTREYNDGDTVPGTPYRVVSLLEAGGMGSVYVVEHIELGRHYVLKSLLRTLSTRHDLILRMRNEWRALGRLHHPNIVDVINAGTTPGGVPFYVMELLSGETVRDRLARIGKLPPSEAVRIAQATLLGLAAAHAIGVVHRDVKPANVFLTREGGVKVLDFGIAQMRVDGAPKITAQGLAIGTPRYMSPEQAAGEKADARSDVYAVGLLLYEMLAGQGPFDDLIDITQQMAAHLHRPPRPLHLWTDVPAGLEQLVLRALAKNPEERPRSAEYMAVELSPFSLASTAERSAAPRFSIPASPTPSGIVITTAKTTDGAHLQPEWDRPTLELMAEGRARRQRALERGESEPPRAASRGRAFAIGAAAAVAGGLAVMAFGFNLSQRLPPTSSPTEAMMARAGGVTETAGAQLLATTSPIVNAEPVLIPGAPPIATTSKLTGESKRSRKRKKPPPWQQERAAMPIEDLIRLPPSGI
jgi:serine/threonine protein kinase